ncbi:hypothetical protein M426DRAFT_320456 [Hypoxylon sp. CI-4A]|nr:hypothetical protein M426DRAFT_320456 [Hypoxylon sp. CI-4A]
MGWPMFHVPPQGPRHEQKVHAYRPQRKPSTSKSYSEFSYDFEKREFRLRFHDRNRAKAYLEKNKDAHVSKDGKHVWLGAAEGMVGLRSTFRGMVVIFGSKDAAKDWCAKSSLFRVKAYSHDRETKFGVFCQPNWDVNPNSVGSQHPGSNSKRSHSRVARPDRSRNNRVRFDSYTPIKKQGHRKYSFLGDQQRPSRRSRDH